MTCGLQRATFNRSSLVRALSDIHPEIPDPKYDFGERLGQWLDLGDALTLYSVLNAEAGACAPVHPAASGVAATLAEQLDRVRRVFHESIHNDGVFNIDPAGAPPRIPFPAPSPDASVEGAAEFSVYHRYYLAHQREMTSTLTTLRSDARKALAAQSAAGRQLAELDAAFERFLLARERSLLANIPILLSKRFDERYAEHCAELETDEAGKRVDDPACWREPGSWLEAFCHDLQAVLLAELELRLKPIAGLISSLAASLSRTDEIRK